MKLALIRHGTTIGNLYGEYVGRQDQPLCSEGIEELTRQKEIVPYPVVEAVYSSPMVRCVQTAKLLYPDQDAIPVPGLQERDFGQFDGLTHKEIIAKPGYGDWGTAPDKMPFPGGEEWEVFSQRVSGALQQLLQHAAQRDLRSAALVCHGGVIMALMERYVNPQKPWYQWQCTPGRGYYIKILSAGDSAVVLRNLPPIC